ncbi:hypothetical protein C5467_23585 [Photorhabdus khanii subsp. guanajuatensis]|uniref:RHS repeat-associated core domain-containing protein n=1 Tax=Photorhabdus khanii subsp. guanajuatensis TaxID=2100166 RepID=A0A4V2X476_9GAMM|nr:hypothetical protein C5467_23585 [Photorhabdus khanii subsp. guanajuatensis]
MHDLPGGCSLGTNRSSGPSRYYSPETGQYLTPDPLGLAGGVSPYSYVHNPVSWVDPLGLTGCPGIKKPSPALKGDPWHPDSVKARQKEWQQQYGPKPSTPGAMQKQVERGQAPRDIERVDKGHIPGQEPHVHYKDGTSSNQSGGVHDAHRGIPNPSKKTIEWLRDHGWTPPN